VQPPGSHGRHLDERGAYGRAPGVFKDTMSQVCPFPSPSDAYTLQSLTPAPTPGPTATFQGIAVVPPSSHLAPCMRPLPHILLPLCAALFKSGGRSKLERWRADSSSGGGSSSSAGSASPGPSFRDVVLLSRPSSPAGQASKSGPWVPLIRELLVAGLHPTPEGGPAKAAAIADGWQTMESRRSKRLRLKVDWFQRPSPGNLSGRCFNCLSPSHLVRGCRSKTRCFKCCGFGHRASLCPVALVRAQVFSSDPKRTVWSRLGGAVPGKASVWSRLQHQQPPGTL
jgi:hypothetical protein